MRSGRNGKEVAYFNGRVYTANRQAPIAKAFILRDGRFSAVGDDSIAEGCPNRVDLQGSCVIPGLVDSHCHMLAALEKAAMGVVDLPSGIRPEELGDVLLRLIKERDLPKDRVFAAMGISLTQGDFSAEDIDRVIPDRPVIVFSDDVHALLLNRKAMEWAGIDETTKDPGDKSYFKRDPEGRPTGLVIEIEAMSMCRSLIEGNEQDPAEILKETCRQYASYGYTTVFEAMSAYYEDDELFEALAEFADTDPGLRISTSFCYRGEEQLHAEEALVIMKNLRERFSRKNLICNTLKLISDGTIEEHSAFLYEPYEDEPDNVGHLMLSVEEMRKMAELAAAEGFHIHIHAIGDRAAGVILELFEGLGPISGTKTIAHNQLYSEAEIRKIIEAQDVYFQTTPHWVEADAFTRDCLGEKRYRMQFPIGTMVRNSVRVTFGSDSCLEKNTANPFLGMYYACARGDADCEGLCCPPQSEGIGREECLLAYTIDGAGQLGLDRETGSIEAGKSADFVILDRDILNCTLEELRETRVRETFFRGNSSWKPMR